MSNAAPLVIWQFVDGKPGHQNQLRGLIQALQEQVAIEITTFTPLTFLSALSGWLRRSFPCDQEHSPDLIIGAGHRTHASVLAAQRSCGGKSVVLMKPSLPRSMFDLCVIPEHDNVRPGPHVAVTCGVLNHIRPSYNHDQNTGLVLLGGPSAHHDWDDDAILQQIATILERDPIAWVLGTSRRTPASMVDKLRQRQFDRLQICLPDEVGADWLPQQLQSAGRIWISEDSVSMVYEALTSGACCGVLEVPHKHSSRVSRGLQQLIERQQISRYRHWLQSGELKSAAEPLNESKRIARMLLDEFIT